MVHCHRKDIFFRYLVVFAKSVYWFNPLIYHFSGIFHEHCEIACDEMLLRDCCRAECLEYARCIADFAGCKKAGFSVGFQSRSTAERRILAIANMHPKTSHRKNRLTKTAVFAIGITAFFLVMMALTIASSTTLRVKLGEQIEAIYFKPAPPKKHSQQIAP